MSEILVTFALAEEARPFQKRIARSSFGHAVLRDDHEPARSAGFSPQGRSLAGAVSRGLKSALLGRSRERSGVRVILTGVGAVNATAALRAALAEVRPALVLTSGFAGALDPALERGTVVYEAAPQEEDAPWLRQALRVLQQEGARSARFVCVDRIAVTAAEKRALRASSGADAVEMESGAIRTECQLARVPCLTVRAISDAAEDDLPLDFNRFLREDRSLQIGKVMLEVARSPRLVKPMLELQRHAQAAAAALATVLGRIVDPSPPSAP